jgi:NAD(P)-dependent dehydrogenase (short-subunit alcohol dehydrogenase family)
MPTALVTGANRGIGLAVVQQLAERGYKVWLGARDETRGRAAAAKLQAKGLDVAWLALDVADEASVSAAAAVVSKATAALDALVNNAAISRERDGERVRPYQPSELPMANLRETFDVNFFGAVTVTQAFLPLVRAAEAGRIVNVSSGLGSFGFNDGSDALSRSLNILG